MAGFLKDCTDVFLENEQGFQGKTHPVKSLIFLQIPSKYHLAVCVL